MWMAKWMWVLGLTAGLLMVSGCKAGEAAPSPAGTYATDFALVFTVEPTGYVDVNDPLQTPSQYVLEADRTLRVALGMGVHPDLFPPPTATLSPADMSRLYQLIEQGKLMDQANEQPPSGQSRYTITITANAHRHRYVTHPDASPASQALLRELVQLRGGKITGRK